MKKYVVRNKTTNKVLGKFDTKNQASEKLVEYITEKNDDVYSDEDGFLSIFDFDVQEEEVQEIASYEDARTYLGLSDEPLMTICGVNKRHEKALLALSKLFTIAEAWNKEDGFVPDFSDWEQDKWFPWFVYDKDAAGFVYACTANAPTVAYALIGSRLCFKSSARAAQFGKQFADLYNKVFL